MEQDIHLGTIDAIPIGANWSIFAIFALILWELADLILPGYAPAATTLTLWIVGVVTTILFFVSLLAHEVSHALVAKHHDIGVRRITLWLFGGVSELESDALTPSADLQIALAGPLVSLLFAGLFALAHALVSTTGTLGVLGAASGWLAWMNVMLGAFNLVPAAPLDGGRVLRAILWRRNGDREAAATSATHAGQFFAYFLVALGVVEFLSYGVGGVWLAFMGWYLLMAARAEEGSIVLRTALGHVRVRDIMTPNPETFPAASSVADLIEHQLHTLRFSTFPLVDAAGELVGLTTLTRVRRVAPDQRATTRLIDTGVAMSEVTTGSPDEPAIDLLERLQRSSEGRALILDREDNLVGIVSPSDIARFVQLRALRTPTRAMRRRGATA